MNGSRIASLGIALPPQELTNADLAPRLGLDESWIVERTGIRTRRIASADETAATLGTEAAQRALEVADVDGTDVDLIICATVTPDWRFPATACLIQTAIGSRGPAFDLNAGCSGFLYALAQADASIRAGAARRALVIGSEVLSRITNYDDPKTGILFGDGAGAALVEHTEGPSSVGPFALYSDGSRPELLYVSNDTGFIQMEGREVFRSAVLGMADSVARLLGDSGVALDDVDLVVAHQANERILDAVATRLGLPAAKMFSNIERYGNTSAASIPIALAEAEASGRVKDGDRVVLAAFGAGFAWGAGLVRWATGATDARTLVAAVTAGV